MPVAKKEQEHPWTDLFRQPQRSVREGRDKHIQPQKLGGKTMYTFKDVLDYAYTQGFIRFGAPAVSVVTTLNLQGNPQSTAVVSIPAIFREYGYDPHAPDDTAPVDVECWGTGDANFENTGNKNIGVHFIRMAETRAKGRALAHALNLDANFAEEMSENEDTNEPPTRQSAPRVSNTQYGKEDPSQFPPANGPDGTWVSVISGEILKDTAQSSAGRKAQWSVAKTGQIMTFNEQQDYVAAQKAESSG